MADENTEKFSITLNNMFEVELDFGGDHAEYKPQFAEYIKLYDIGDIGTLMNIQNWANSRGVPCKITIHGYFSIYSWLARILLVLNRWIERNGRAQDAVGPKKWDR